MTPVPPRAGEGCLQISIILVLLWLLIFKALLWWACEYCS